KSAGTALKEKRVTCTFWVEKTRARPRPG
ncbi:hypothetical protein pipiens_004104, partial [Culex pipiens pipiens]